jgi:hypothetical protein
MNNIKNIIFDLGGVFIDINYQKTETAFINAGVINFKDLYVVLFCNFANLNFVILNFLIFKYINEMFVYKI